MYIETVPNRESPPAILVREGWREGGKVKKRTLANLSKWPRTKVDTLRRLLKNEPLVGRGDAFDIVRSRPHGHVAAALGTLRKLRLDRTIAGADSPERRRAVALIVARILDPGSKLATARGLAEATARDSLAETLGLDDCGEDDLYAAMDWLLERRDAIERRLAKRHLEDGALVQSAAVSSDPTVKATRIATRGIRRGGYGGSRAFWRLTPGEFLTLLRGFDGLLLDSIEFGACLFADGEGDADFAGGDRLPMRSADDRLGGFGTAGSFSVRHC